LIGGNRNFSPDSNRAASARASRTWEAVMESMMDVADPNVNQRAARDINESGECMESV
jgi:hypothetical protein